MQAILQQQFLDLTALGWQAVAALTGIGALLAAVAAAWVALRQLSAARQIRNDQIRPYVIVDFEPGAASRKLIDLTVRNIGSTPAYDVLVKLDPPPERTQETLNFLLKDTRIFNKPVAMFAPGREFRTFFDSAPDRYSTELPMSYAVTISYEDSRGRRYREQSVLEFDVGRGALYTEAYGIHDVVDNLKRLVSTLQNSAIANEQIEIVHERYSAHRKRKRAEREVSSKRHDELKSLLLTRKDNPPQDDQATI